MSDSTQPKTSRAPLKRVVVTGGPAAGKTTALKLLERRFDSRCSVVPESATILYSGGFVRSPEVQVVKAAQRAIFEIQNSLERSFEYLNPGKVLICDRGSLDGAVYWPDGEAAFFDEFSTTHRDELHRYEAVIFFETSAVCDFQGTRGNRCRNESRDQALRLEEKLRKLYEHHPRFHFVAHEPYFADKVEASLTIFESLLRETLPGEVPLVGRSVRSSGGDLHAIL